MPFRCQDHDAIKWNRIMIVLFEHDLRANAFRDCREAKQVSTFPDHVLVLLRHKTLMVRRRPCAVSNHEGHVACFRVSGPRPFQTLARASSSG